MTERRQRIPASEVHEPKRWNLPFWTEPKHVVHSEEDVEEEVLVEDEEIEVEPLTAEQLETIRQEAFNEGLEQGLIEGRQKGEKLGYDEGYQEGVTKGEGEGKKLGFDAGFEQGEKQAFSNGSAEQEVISKRFQSLLEACLQQLQTQKQELESNIPDIVLAIAKAVITEELSQGSEHIITLVQQALEALPLDSGELRIDVNPQDLPFIEAAIEQGEFEGVAHSSDNIEAGGCRIHTRYSSVDFTLSERWQAIERQYRHQLQLASNQEQDDDAQPNFDALDEFATSITKPDITEPEISPSHPTEDDEQTTSPQALDIHSDTQEEPHQAEHNADVPSSDADAESQGHTSPHNMPAQQSDIEQDEDESNEP